MNSWLSIKLMQVLMLDEFIVGDQTEPFENVFNACLASPLCLQNFRAPRYRASLPPGTWDDDPVVAPNARGIAKHSTGIASAT